MSTKKICITGGAGFIGSHLVKKFVNSYPNYHIYVIDNLTYAGNMYNLVDVKDNANFHFIFGDISDREFIFKTFKKFKFDSVINLAAESHVDRSITNPLIFVKTNIIGTLNLLDAALEIWGVSNKEKLFFHVSTDEVYGSLGETGLFTEESNYQPNSPYSASKASSDHLVRAYGETYELPVIISNCSNNYGENQFPEKLIPLFIQNIIDEHPLPVYGDGNYTRDWLYVKDHINAIELIFHNSPRGQTYNIGGHNEIKNIDLINLLCDKMDTALSRKRGSGRKLIKFVKDRPGHDFRYAIDASKINKKLGWTPSLTFDKGLELTINWYLKNKSWLKNVKSGRYKDFNNTFKI